MDAIKVWFRKYPKMLSVTVALLIAVSGIMILIAPLKIQIVGVRDLVRPSVIETIDSFELEKIGNGILQEDVLTKEDGTYLGTQLADTLLSILPGSVEIELSLSDIEYIFGQYSDTRSFVESSTVSSDIIVQTILGMVIDEIFGTHAIETEEQIFQIINLYRMLFYCLLLLSLVSIVLVFYRRTFAVIIWLVPAAIISTGLAVAATVGDAFVAYNVYEDMYIRFPAGMLAGLALAVAAQLLYRKGLQIEPAPSLEEQAQESSESQSAPALRPTKAQPQAEARPQAEPAQAASEEARPSGPLAQDEPAQSTPKTEQAFEQPAEDPVETELVQEAEAEPALEQLAPAQTEQSELEIEQTPEPESEVASTQAPQAVREAVQQLKAQTGPNIKVQVVPADDSHASETKTIEIKLTIDVSTL